MPTGDSVSTTNPSRSGWGNLGESITIRTVASGPPERIFIYVFGGDVMKNLQAERQLPDHMYVDVPTITKRLSLACVLVCLLSMIVFLITGFSAIQPIIAILAIVAAGTFYAMAEVIRRSYHDRV